MENVRKKLCLSKTTVLKKKGFDLSVLLAKPRNKLKDKLDMCQFFKPTHFLPVVTRLLWSDLFFVSLSQALTGPKWHVVSSLTISSLFTRCFFCRPSYLPLCEVEHCDEAEHLVRVIVITVFWHLSLLKRHNRDGGWTPCFLTTHLTARGAHLDDAAHVILLDDDFCHLWRVDVGL